MNQKMLDLLTDKEIENEDLLQKIENIKLESELENEKNLERIKILEEKIMNLEDSKRTEGNKYDIDSIINEYNNYKERLKKQMNFLKKNERKICQKDKEKKVKKKIMKKTKFNLQEKDDFYEE